ncbi:MAG: DUF1499 domain-containing protein [Alphaproteobacteria bacterium]
MNQARAAGATHSTFPLDFESLRLTKSPNQYLMLPAGSRDLGQHGASPNFGVPLGQLLNAFFDVVENEARVTPTNSYPEANQYEFVQRSRIFGFPDVITMQFVSTGEGASTLAIYSRSKYGRGDLGVNRRRVMRWLDLVRDSLAVRSAGMPRLDGARQ